MVFVTFYFGWFGGGAIGIVHASLMDVVKIRNEDIFSALQQTSMFWLINRSARFAPDWTKWIIDPRELVVE